MELCHILELSNIIGFNTTQSLLSSFDERHGSLEISIGSFLLDTNGGLFVNDHVLSVLALNGLLFSSCVLNGKSSNQLVGFLSCDLEFLVLNKEGFLHLTNTDSSFQKLVQSTLNGRLLDINFLPLLLVEVLVHSKEGEVGLGSGEHTLSHLDKVLLGDFTHHIVTRSHVLNELFFDFLCAFNVELTNEATGHVN